MITWTEFLTKTALTIAALFVLVNLPLLISYLFK
jgi:hypothetical protein